jgi:RimJ/RimL family protein N-acetyltransferase
MLEWAELLLSQSTLEVSMKSLHGTARTIPDRTGRIVTYRAIALGDIGRLERFHKELSPQTVWQRYSSVVPLHTRIEWKRLERQCSIDEYHSFAVVALYDDHLLGVGRFTRTGNQSGEVAFVVRDTDQAKHIGKELVRSLLAWIEEHFHDSTLTLTAQCMATNERMKSLLVSSGFQIIPGRDHRVTTARRVLR